MILTIDLGTTVTKVALWSDQGMVAVARAGLPTGRPELGWAEQEPFGWWTSVVVACAEARANAPDAFGQVEAVGCSGARQTFVPVTSSGEPLGRGLLWSDRRAVAEAAWLNAAMGDDQSARALTGVPLDGGSMAAKVAWLSANDPGRLAASDWLLAPRDLITWRLTGELATDRTLASRTGLYDFDGSVVEALAGPAAGRLPRVAEADTVLGGLRAVPAAELGLRPGIPVVIGAGDRPCEVLGAGASAGRPMVAWGTTANVSIPVATRPDRPPEGVVVSRGAVGGWLLEGGLSAAGSFLGWLGRLLGSRPEELAQLASGSPAGARGVIAVPWLDGARAPWWRDDARAGFVGLASAHDGADLARAVLESVAWEVARCLRAVTASSGPVRGVTLGGSGSGIAVWVAVLTGVTGLPATRRRSGEAASAGAALLTARATAMYGVAPGSGTAALNALLETLDPVVDEIEPDPAAVTRYEELRSSAEQVAATLVTLGTAPVPTVGTAPARTPGTGSPRT